MKKILFCLLLLPFAAIGSEEGYRLDTSPHDVRDLVSLQSGARTYVNYCLGCHSAQYVRYKSLTEIGLTEAQIREHLLFSGDKVGDAIKSPVPAQAKQWFGVVPPDLSVIARSRGPDWLYTYLRTFYRDPKTPTGWNNAVFPNVAMPHVLWEYQGDAVMHVTEKMDPGTGDMKVSRHLALERPGTLKPVDYDLQVADLVNYLAYMAEPAQTDRKQWGILVLFFLAGFFVLTLMLKTEYWKDVR